ncbi:SDR family oxidoreductase [Variovorax sp. Sphag1AA]|uniref:SDR family oxidoreductase n=1 Tax=Variovorax sp. Sphag1AA TaxID=2587027 RepID=UPI00160C9A27|nr:SDR family oxidoreductase [Variovorax sp. Sphag1AA]MBB3178745.1 NAD(P)-dependent dehydrogenase (short-subunit alcohol dehydrogenase family) [Variovorax sp. Sphag1AA]
MKDVVLVTGSGRAGTVEKLDAAAVRRILDVDVVGLARELAPDGIRVNAVLPGIIETAIHEKAGLAAKMPDLLQLVPMRRIGQPEECAQAIAWLLSDRASYVSGAVLPVTGAR